MLYILQKLPFLLELFFNGSFILLYSLLRTNKIPKSWNQDFVKSTLEVAAWMVPIVLFFVIVVNYINTQKLEDFIRKYIFSIMVFVPLCLTLGDIQFAFWLSAAHLFSSVLTLYETEGVIYGKKKDRTNEKKRLLVDWQLTQLLKPAQLLLGSFFLLIAAGTFLLMLPFSVLPGEKISFYDALFMASSATCVTGLTTVSLADVLSPFGQMVILLLIQIGGLGIMTLSSSMTILLGKSMAMRDRIVMQDLLDVSSLEKLFSMIIDIIKYSFIIELWGGIILTIAFIFEGFDFGKALYYGFFHAISAFCNAGFSMFNNSLENFTSNPLINITISVLIILGGLGFIVLKELKAAIIERRSFERLSLHTKIVLVTNLVLIFAGFFIIFFGEFLNALDGYDLWQKVQISMFQSVTLRTAGFNTIPLNSLNSYTIYMMTLFMFVGASPGSTGGGIKTTTFAILIQSIRATLKGESNVTLFKWRVSPAIVVKTSAITMISIIIASIFIFILMKLEPDKRFLTIYFEAISALGTVGLSLGITPFLSDIGKVAVTLLMYIGRVGPLTLVLAIAQQKSTSGKVEYPDGKIMIG